MDKINDNERATKIEKETSCPQRKIQYESNQTNTASNNNQSQKNFNDSQYTNINTLMNNNNISPGIIITNINFLSSLNLNTFSKLETSSDENVSINKIKTISIPQTSKLDLLYEPQCKLLKFLPPKNTSCHKTLVLDLDETLIHSYFDCPSPRTPDLSFDIVIDNKKIKVNSMIRPGARDFLENMSGIFEIVIFTASLSEYANPLLDFVDNKKICKYRLFREHCCSFKSGFTFSFTKDLKKLDRDMRNLIIIDNNPKSFILNKENGIPIKTWVEDLNDRELYKLIPYLLFLGNENIEDVRPFLKDVNSGPILNYEKLDKIISDYKNKSNKTKSNNSENKSKIDDNIKSNDVVSNRSKTLSDINKNSGNISKNKPNKESNLKNEMKMIENKKDKVNKEINLKLVNNNKNKIDNSIKENINENITPMNKKGNEKNVKKDGLINKERVKGRNIISSSENQAKINISENKSLNLSRRSFPTNKIKNSNKDMLKTNKNRYKINLDKPDILSKAEGGINKNVISPRNNPSNINKNNFINNSSQQLGNILKNYKKERTNHNKSTQNLTNIKHKPINLNKNINLEIESILKTKKDKHLSIGKNAKKDLEIINDLMININNVNSVMNKSNSIANSLNLLELPTENLRLDTEEDKNEMPIFDELDTDKNENQKNDESEIEKDNTLENKQTKIVSLKMEGDASKNNSINNNNEKRKFDKNIFNKSKLYPLNTQKELSLSSKTDKNYLFSKKYQTIMKGFDKSKNLFKQSIRIFNKELINYSTSKNQNFIKKGPKEKPKKSIFLKKKPINEGNFIDQNFINKMNELKQEDKNIQKNSQNQLFPKSNSNRITGNQKLSLNKNNFISNNINSLYFMKNKDMLFETRDNYSIFSYNNDNLKRPSSSVNKYKNIVCNSSKNENNIKTLKFSSQKKKIFLRTSTKKSDIYLCNKSSKSKNQIFSRNLILKNSDGTVGEIQNKEKEEKKRDSEKDDKKIFNIEECKRRCTSALLSKINNVK